MILALLLACGEAAYPCAGTGDPGLDVVPAGLAFDGFVDGEPLPYGNPPQGGAPYAPLRVRVAGLADLDLGVHLDVIATDADEGTALGGASLDTRLVCANVGDSAGMWTGADVHLRFPGWSLDDLEGRTAEVVLTAADPDGEVVQAQLLGLLHRM